MLDKTYDPKEIEARRYPEWESSGAFKAHPETQKPPYCIVIPPPNVTGSLHMGHALNNTLQDVLIRFERMRGKAALWLPGTDHAGIATQMVVERQLAEAGNMGRRDMGRDAFVAKVNADLVGKLVNIASRCAGFIHKLNGGRLAAALPEPALYADFAGAADDLAGGRSTFMVEMTEAAFILHHASAQSLVLMDEIGRGTSTFDGLALAWAIARHLAEKNGSLALFATHYFELTALARELKQVANVHLDAVEHKESIVFLHSVEEGPADRSYGLQVAQLAGVPGTVIRAARRRLSELEELGLKASPQRDLFASGAPAPEEPPSHAALDLLRAADPDALTPREALELLYRLRQKLDE